MKSTVLHMTEYSTKKRFRVTVEFDVYHYRKDLAEDVARRSCQFMNSDYAPAVFKVAGVEEYNEPDNDEPDI